MKQFMSTYEAAHGKIVPVKTRIAWKYMLVVCRMRVEKDLVGCVTNNCQLINPYSYIQCRIVRLVGVVA